MNILSKKVVKTLLLITTISLTNPASIYASRNHNNERDPLREKGQITRDRNNKKSPEDVTPRKEFSSKMLSKNASASSSLKDTGIKKFKKVLNDTFTALRDEGGLPALRVIASSLKKSDPLSAFSLDNHDKINLRYIAAHLMGKGQLPDFDQFSYTDSNGEHNHVQDAFKAVFKKGKNKNKQRNSGSVGIASTPEDANSDKRAEMVSMIRIFNRSHSFLVTNFYQTIHTLFNTSENQNEQGHLRAILKYIHVDWAVNEEEMVYPYRRNAPKKRTTSHLVLNIPEAPELNHIEDFIAGKKIQKIFDLDGKTIEINREPLTSKKGTFPTINNLLDLKFLHLNCDLSRTIACIDLDHLKDVEERRGIIIQNVAQNLSEKGALTLFLKTFSQQFIEKDARKQRDTIYAPQIQGNAHIHSQNETNKDINPLAPFLRANIGELRDSIQERNSAVRLLNAYMDPTLYIKDNNSGKALTDLLEEAHVSATYTVLMVHTDENMLLNAQQALEKEGYTFIGVQLKDED